MEQKHIVLNSEKDGHVFTFLVPVGASWGNATDAAFELLNYVHAMTKQQIEKVKPEIEKTKQEEQVILGEVKE